jgi:hypothetical protein
MRAISRVCDVSINTVTKLLVDAGFACAAFHNEKVRNVVAKRVQCDEIWAFTHCKQKRVAIAKRPPPGAGDTWTWTGICAESKLIVSWLVGGRDSGYAIEFMDDLRSRLANRVQLTTDGNKSYLEAVEGAFGADVGLCADREAVLRSPGGHEGPLQPSRMHRDRQVADRGQPRPEAREHVLRRAQQSHDAHVNAALHAPDQRALKNGGEPLPRARDLFRLVQLGADQFGGSHVASDGRWADRQAVGLDGPRSDVSFWNETLLSTILPNHDLPPTASSAHLFVRHGGAA